MKSCPNCKHKIIPMKWILLHQIFKKECNFCVCSHCGKNITTGQLVNFDWIYTPFTDLIFTPIVLLVLYYTFGLVNSILLVSLYITVFMALYLFQQYLVPLEEAVETKCKEKGMTRIQALFALMTMVAVIGMSFYALIVKPLILNKAIF